MGRPGPPSVNELDALTRDYRTAFLRYLPRREEAALTSGYELGRGAVSWPCSRLAWKDNRSSCAARRGRKWRTR